MIPTTCAVCGRPVDLDETAVFDTRTWTARHTACPRPADRPDPALAVPAPPPQRPMFDREDRP